MRDSLLSIRRTASLAWNTFASRDYYLLRRDYIPAQRWLSACSHAVGPAHICTEELGSIGRLGECAKDRIFSSSSPISIAAASVIKRRSRLIGQSLTSHLPRSNHFPSVVSNSFAPWKILSADVVLSRLRLSNFTDTPLVPNRTDQTRLWYPIDYPSLNSSSQRPLHRDHHP